MMIAHLPVADYTSLPEPTIRYYLQQEEGISPKPYCCSAGHLTVGVGHNLDVSPVDELIGRIINKDSLLTPDEIDLIFHHDLMLVLQQLTDKVKDFKMLDQTLQYVLISMTFNMGITGVMKFKQMLKALGNGDRKGVMAAMVDSAWATQLPNRSARLIKIVKVKHLPS